MLTAGEDMCKHRTNGVAVQKTYAVLVLDAEVFAGGSEVGEGVQVESWCIFGANSERLNMRSRSSWSLRVC